MGANRRLRILSVLSRLETHWVGGIGRVTSAMATALAARGHEVHVAGRAPGGNPPGMISGVHVHAWPPDTPKGSQIRKLFPLQREIRADVVHFHSAVPHGDLVAPFRILRGLVGSPLLVCTPHVGDASQRPRGRARFALKCTDLVVVPSQWSADWAKRAGAHPRRIAIVWNGVDRVVKVPSGDRKTLILALGNLVERKGMDLLLDAFSDLSPYWPEWRLVIAGEGPQQSLLRERVEHEGLRVALPGLVRGAAKEALLRSASLGVVPSRRDMIPGAMLELQAYGVPTVATAVGAIPEGAEDGRAALVCEPTKESLVEAISRLLADGDLRDRLSLGALQASKKRLWSQLSARLEKHYFDALATDPRLGRLGRRIFSRNAAIHV